MKKLIIWLVALCLCVPLLPVSIGTAEAAGTENTDFQTKYDALPKNDMTNLYIINSENSDVVKIPIGQLAYSADLSSEPSFRIGNFPVFFLYWDLTEMKRAGCFASDAGWLFEGETFDSPYPSTYPYGLCFGMNEDFMTAINAGNSYCFRLGVSSGYEDDSAHDPSKCFDFIPVRKWIGFETRGFSRSSFVSNLELVRPRVVKKGGTQLYYAAADYYCYDGYVAFSADFRDIGAVGETLYIYVNCPETKYNVTFEYLDGSGSWTSSTTAYESGTAASSVVRPELPTAPYATFSSWNKGIVAVMTDIVYRAVYTYDQFLLTFYNRDGTIAKTERATYYKDFSGYSYWLPDYFVTEDHKKQIFKHVGWTTDPQSASTKVDFSGLRVASNLSLYPLYEYAGSVDVDDYGVEIDTSSGLSKLWDSEWNLFGMEIPIGKIAVVLAIILLLPLILWLVPLVAKLIKSAINTIKNLFGGFRRKSR